MLIAFAYCRGGSWTYGEDSLEPHPPPKGHLAHCPGGKPTRKAIMAFSIPLHIYYLYSSTSQRLGISIILPAIAILPDEELWNDLQIMLQIRCFAEKQFTRGKPRIFACRIKY